MRCAYATTLTHGDAYAPGVEVLGRSLQATGTTLPMVVMVTCDVSVAARTRLSAGGWTVREVEPIKNPRPASALLFPRFAATFSKLRAWELSDFDKVVLLDADLVVLSDISELFDHPELAAAPDFLRPDKFNSGVMVLAPSPETLARMLLELAEMPTYDGGDQGFLNAFFAGWYSGPSNRRLATWFNLPNFIYQFMRAHPLLSAEAQREAKIIHYLVQKPWDSSLLLTGGSALWWTRYLVGHPELDSAWKRQLHSLEDSSFDRCIAALIG